jgi:hypothetical protein
MRRQTDRAVYVYALSSPGLPRRLSVQGRRLNCIAIGDVDAIVEDSPPGRSLDDIQLQHRVVTHLAARATALLPARFGSVVTESALHALVSDRREEIRSALRHVRNCEQMTVRVFGPAPSESAADAGRSGTAYLLKRQDRAHHVAAEVEVIRRELGGLVKDERVAPGDRGIRAVVYHLVARRTVAQYRRRALVLPSLLMPHAVTVTGPWPVFAFAPELF